MVSNSRGTCAVWTVPHCQTRGWELKSSRGTHFLWRRPSGTGAASGFAETLALQKAQTKPFSWFRGIKWNRCQTLVLEERCWSGSMSQWTHAGFSIWCQISIYVSGKYDAVDLQKIIIVIIAILFLQVKFFLPCFTIVMHRAGMRSQCWDTSQVDVCVLGVLQRSSGRRRRKD